MSVERHNFEFGEFRLEAKEKVLLRNGKPVAITPKVFHLLLILLENHGHIVTKEELIKTIWADSFVEESNLPFNARMLRKVLGDDANQPKFVETVPRRGYRFIGEVKESFEGAAVHSSIKPYLPWGISLILLLALIFMVAWFWQIGSKKPALSAPILSAPFKSEKFSNSGNVNIAVISPDGKYVAYTEESNGKYGIWLRQIETAENIQVLPPSDDFYGGLTFNHDGSSFFFTRHKKDQTMPFDVFHLSTFGGIPIKIIEKTEGWISLSPDDKQISFVRCEHKDDDNCSLFVSDTDGQNEKKLLTCPSPIRIADNQFSPDGKSIAFAIGQSWNGANEFALSRIDLENGAISEITPRKFFNIKNLKWLPDGKNLLFTAKEVDEKIKIWQVSTVTGLTEVLTKDAANYISLSLDKTGGRMVATQISDNFRLYFSSLKNPANPKILTNAIDVTFAPSGKIVYTAGNKDIWTINPDGSEQRQLTNNNFNDFYPKVSPDERFIFFTSNRSGSDQVWRMNTDGSNQIQITKNEGGYPRFISPDGKWVYYESGLHRTFWKISADGGNEVQILGNKIYSPAVSPDGNLLAYFFPDNDNQTKIGIMTLADRKIFKIISLQNEKFNSVRLAWANDNKTLTFLTLNESKNLLRQQSLDDSQSHFSIDLGDKEVPDFALAPDGNSMVFIRGSWLNDAVIFDGLK